MSTNRQRFTWLILLIFVSASAKAQLNLPEIFSNDMVLQRAKKIPIWGKAKPGATVQVHFATQYKSTTAAADSNWVVYLDPLKANKVGQELVISSDITKTFSNVLVGDVWLCSGQSNMEYPLDRTITRYAGPKRGEDRATAALKKDSQSPLIRYIYVEKQLNKYPQLPSKGWFMGNDTMLRRISAIGYFFSNEIEQETGVPIGIISTSWGGTRIEEWTPVEAYASSSFFSAAYQKEQKIDGMRPGQKYRALVQPLVPFAVKGVLWYQGESNAVIEDQATYPEKFKLFIDTWRDLFNDQQLPFYTVQLAPNLYSIRKDAKVHAPEMLAEFWEAQTKCLSFPNVDMAVISDLVDDLRDIHPSYKWEVAHRLALQVLKKEYGQKALQAHSPFFVSAKQKGDAISVKLKHAQGLHTSDGGSIKGFRLAAADGSWVQADARIVGQTIVVSAAGIRAPQKLRFAWEEKAQTNLVNGAGLPANAFQVNLK